MLLNFSNHPSSRWGKEQLKAAEEYGGVTDLAFPRIPAEADMRYIDELAEEMTEQILECSPDAVLCQGEFTLCYAVIRRLRAMGIPCLAACSERVAVEVCNESSLTKTSVFQFKRFRMYE